MKQRTCDKCLLLDGCEFGARYKPACKVYIDDPFKLAAHEAKWSFRVKDRKARKSPSSNSELTGATPAGGASGRAPG